MTKKLSYEKVLEKEIPWFVVLREWLAEDNNELRTLDNISKIEEGGWHESEVKRDPYEKN